MDPDFEGQDYVQMLLLAVDPKRRLDAIVPQITWHDLTYSLSPGGVPKTGWLSVLVALGNVGTGFSLDPEVLSLLDDVILRNGVSPEGFAFLRYHSLKYFCDGDTLPPFRPADAPPRVDALFMQGQHDVLFNLNEAHANFECLSRAGGDVRLYTYQAGHVLPSGLGLLSRRRPRRPTSSVAAPSMNCRWSWRGSTPSCATTMARSMACRGAACPWPRATASQWTRSPSAAALSRYPQGR